MYKYFISYNVKNSGFGNSEVNVESKICNINDVNNIARQIEITLGYKEQTIAILNFRLFDEE